MQINIDAKNDAEIEAKNETNSLSDAKKRSRSLKSNKEASSEAN